VRILLAAILECDQAGVSPQGEELTLDYGQETESAKEQRRSNPKPEHPYHCCISPQGEELTLDYGQETESEKEQRAAVCLCGADGCRGSFLTYASHAAGAAQPQQQVSWACRTIDVPCLQRECRAALAAQAGHVRPGGQRNNTCVGRITICSRPPAGLLHVLMPLRHLQACMPAHISTL
jgi:hypothetical protein